MKRTASFLVKYEAPLAAGLALLSMAGARLLLPACLGMALFWPLRRLATGRWSVRTPVDLPVIALLPLLLLNSLISALPETTVPQILRLLSGIGLFYALANALAEKDRFPDIQRWVFSAGLGLVALAFFAVDWSEAGLPLIGAEFAARIPLLVQDPIHPNVLAGNLMLFAILSAAFVLWDPLRSRAIWILTGLAGAAMLAVLALTQSRGALIAFASAGLLLAALRWRRGGLAALAAAAGTVWAAAALGYRSLADLVFGGGLLDGLQGRIEIWARAIFAIQDFAFTGTGMGLFPEAAARIYPYFSPEPSRIEHAHNLFLQVGADLGIPGLIAWLAIFLGVLAAGLNLYRRGRRTADRRLLALGAGLVAVQLAVAVHGLFDAVLWGQVRAAPSLLWAVWAIAMYRPDQAGAQAVAARVAGLPDPAP